MMYCMNTAEGLTELGKLIQQHLDRLDWSRNELGRRAGLDSGTVSRLMRGVTLPTHESVEKVADALRLDHSYLKQVAGLPAAPPPAERDERVEYIAQQLQALPEDMREDAIDALGGQLASYYRIMERAQERERLVAEIFRLHPELAKRVQQQILARDSDSLPDSSPPAPIADGLHPE